MNTEYVQHPTLAKYMVNMWIMFTMCNTLPGTYVKNHPSLSIYQEIIDSPYVSTNDTSKDCSLEL
jgi:hypothetical protein